MKIAVLGTGMVGETIAAKLVQLGHEVMMGSRTADNEKAAAWVKKAGKGASQGTFADAARHGEIAFNCTAGVASIEALKAAGADNLKGKVLLDIANPLDFSKGMPPRVLVNPDDSLGEQIQRAFPDTRVVKTLNTVNCMLMVDANRVAGGDHTMFMAGNDAQAKGRVAEILRGWFGWKHVLDLGDLSAARGMEWYLGLWVRSWGALGTGDFNVKIVKNG
jgi:8-hydroxy-5-deazaflavin:NADPH oxidoreductase